MINLEDLTGDDDFDDFEPNTSSSTVNTSFTSEQVSSVSNEYDGLKIKMLLKKYPDKYVLVDNKRINQIKPSQCWQQFALPAVRDENGRSTVIKGFATCRLCLSTYAFKQGSTKTLNKHKCSVAQSSPSSLLINSKSPFNLKKKTLVTEKKTLSSLITRWICENMRPISIVEDDGFLNIIQYCINLGDAGFGEMKGNEFVPSRTTVTREIIRQADEIRERLSHVLKNAATNGFLSISPDLWTDKFKQNSYLGLTAHFIDQHNKLCSLDICCEPYNQIDKRGDNIRKAILNALARFGIDTMVEKIFFVTDRGSNLVKALEGFNVVNCFLHRLNNILKRTFYSAGTREKTEKKNMNKTKKTTSNNESTWHDLEQSDQDPLLDYDDRDSNTSESNDENLLDEKSVKLALRNLEESSSERDHINVPQQNVSPQAGQILTTIIQCKQLCCYVKRVNWNPMLQEIGKPTIKQEIVVRWVSMSQLMESILCSYSSLTTIAGQKGTVHTLPSIDISIVSTIVQFFAPWKHVMEKLQASKTPTIHLVVPSYWYILEKLGVTKEEMADKSARGLTFFKIRARQLLTFMFKLHDVHWIAAVLNPRTRMLKMASEVERNHAHDLVRSELTKILDMKCQEDCRSIQLLSNNSPSSPACKKFKSYTIQFEDDEQCTESNNIGNPVRARREMETYLQFNIANLKSQNDDRDDLLHFWREQENLLPNLSILSKKILCIPASSAAVERTFSSAGVVVSQRRTSIKPSLVNDIILIRSAGAYLKDKL